MTRTYAKRGRNIVLHVGSDMRNAYIKSLSPAERWTRVAFKLLVADCPYRPVLCISHGYPMPDRTIAQYIDVPLPLWKRTKHKMIKAGELEYDPRIGLKCPKWRSSNPHDFFKQFAKAEEVLALSEEELELDRTSRQAVVDQYNTITGHSYNHDQPLFVTRFRARMAEGATQAQIMSAVRKFCWVYMNGTPKMNALMGAHKPLAPTTFWKWVKKDCPEPVYEMISTREFISSLDTDRRKRALELCSKYFQNYKLAIRVEGWDDPVDIDYKKVMPCREYISLMLR